MNSNRRTALRFAICICAIGGERIPIQRRSPSQWALDLQRQLERMRRGLSPEIAKAPKAAARALIRRKGYRRAVTEAVSAQTTSPEVGKPGWRSWRCRPGNRHPDHPMDCRPVREEALGAEAGFVPLPTRAKKTSPNS